MIVVTGAGRSGTSLMMQTLSLLGIPMLGEPSNNNVLVGYDKSKDDDLTRLAKELNPKGYWEISIDDLKEGLPNSFNQDVSGKAIKLFPGFFCIVNIHDIEKLIICKRKDQTEQTVSLKRSCDLEHKVCNRIKKEIPEFLRKNSYVDIKKAIAKSLDLIDKFINTYPNIPTLVVYFEDITTDPKREIERVAKFCNSNADLSASIANVDRRL
jgi:hypothetical protein